MMILKGAVCVAWSAGLLLWSNLIGQEVLPTPDEIKSPPPQIPKETQNKSPSHTASTRKIATDPLQGFPIEAFKASFKRQGLKWRLKEECLLPLAPQLHRLTLAGKLDAGILTLQKGQAPSQELQECLTNKIKLMDFSQLDVKRSSQILWDVEW